MSAWLLCRVSSAHFELYLSTVNYCPCLLVLTSCRHELNIFAKFGMQLHVLTMEPSHLIVRLLTGSRHIYVLG